MKVEQYKPLEDRVLIKKPTYKFLPEGIAEKYSYMDDIGVVVSVGDDAKQVVAGDNVFFKGGTDIEFEEGSFHLILERDIHLAW